MNKDEIIRMAREAGFNASNGFSALIVRHSNGSWVDVLNELELFAHIVAAAKQEKLNALEQPEQEPVAWRTFDGEGGYDYRTYEDNENYAAEWAKRNPRHVNWVDPLYAHPPPRNPLTDELYNELLFAVGRKHLNETRHQTALRYIRQAEMPNSEPAKAAHGIGEEP